MRDAQLNLHLNDKDQTFLGALEFQLNATCNQVMGIYASEPRNASCSGPRRLW